MSNKNFSEIIKKRWKELRKDKLSDKNINNIFKTESLKIKDYSDLDKVKELNKWIKKRIKWLDKNMKNINNVAKKYK